MTSVLEAKDLVLALRGQRELRPRVDPALAGGLRAWLEDDLSELAKSLDPSAPLFISPRALCADPHVAASPIIGFARATLLSALIAQRLTLGGVEHAMDDALSALEADPRHDELVEAIHALEPDSFAQLAAEVAAHDTVLAHSLGAVPPSWLPRCTVRLSVPIIGNRIVLGAVADVVIGPPASEVASVCLIDITTSDLGDEIERRLGVLSLIETLRSGAQPLRVASLSTATGDVAIVDVGDEVLAAAVADVVSAAKRLSAVR